MRSLAAWTFWPIAVVTACARPPQPPVAAETPVPLPVVAAPAPDAGASPKTARGRHEGRAVVFIAGRPTGAEEDQYRFVPLHCVDNGKVGHGARCAAGLPKNLELRTGDGRRMTSESATKNA